MDRRSGDARRDGGHFTAQGWGWMVGIKLRVIADSFGSYRDQTDPIKR